MAIDSTIVEIFGEPPDGINLNENNAAASDISFILLICLASISVALRLGARVVQNAGFKADDYLMMAALAFSISTSVLTKLAIAAGAGRHVWALTTGRVVLATKFIFILGFIYAAAAWAIKASIILLYIRLFSKRSFAFMVCIYSAAFCATGVFISSIVGLCNSCRPTSYFWEQFTLTVEGECINIASFFIAMAGLNVFLDFYLLVMPIPQVLGLQMSVQRKMIVCTSLLLGVFVCAAGLVRIYYLHKFYKTRDQDYSWDLGPVGVWLSVEPSIGIVTACVPNAMPLYFWLCERIRSLMDQRGGDRGSRRHHRTVQSKDFDRNRLPSYIENNMVLRPKEEDEIRLTTLATAARNSNESVHQHGIMVRSEVTQTIETESLKRVSRSTC